MPILTHIIKGNLISGCKFAIIIKIIMSLLKHIMQLDKPACCVPKIMFLNGASLLFGVKHFHI